ncbi:DUF2460 domain-containing protein [Candidatus Anaplasma sp. TIGMIC]|uniref:DUF2460 domain-containing protein n=1 Tax=Candidatus Anaplasma sp. TIGMIC TaxID=3020713 RepID=UPI00232F0BA9|nr:DUF2460 domain-containing protein [Candidatus Anaplasma sp. TIGMIC]MDB1134991.1 DUF2460 domain-containing protein [Candidatus Anaplasma sp. TIGMIC]
MQEDIARFPVDISYGSVGGPYFSTNVVKLENDHEHRIINWVHSRCKYNVIYGVKSEAEFSALVEFFYAHKGKAIPFRFKDWADYKAVHQKIGVGDGILSKFQLIKKYSAGTNLYRRTITKPVEGTVKIYLKDALQAHKKDYAVDYNSGLVSFTNPPAPGVDIYADFEFDVLTRFDTDYLPCSIDGYGRYRCPEIPLIEVKD